LIIQIGWKEGGFKMVINAASEEVLGEMRALYPNSPIFLLTPCPFEISPNLWAI